MIIKYVLRNFRRRKVRTILMLLALTVGVAALVALNATVDTYERFYVATISNDTGDYDLVITKKDIEPDLLLNITQLSPVIKASSPQVKQVVPRIQGEVDVDIRHTRQTTNSNASLFGTAQFIALDRQIDDFGNLQLISGTLDLSPGYAVILQETANTFNLRPGDTFDISYGLPLPRRKGVASALNTSTRQAKTTLTVSGIALQFGVTGITGNDGILVDLAYTQNWLGLSPQQAERLVVAFDESVYSNNDPQAAAIQARFLTEKVQNLVGESYQYSLPRATVLSNTFEAFIFFQALVSIYGLLSLSVVGLLIRTMIMTNVREQTRDLALIRILGAPRSHLFNLVAAEVALLGLLGIGTGVLLGQLLTNTVVVPFIAEQANVPLKDVPLVTPNALLLSVMTAAIVLAVSAYAPAQRAASTKIMYAINPGVAEGLGFDDLAKLRERRVNFRIFWSGLVVLFYPALIFFVFPLAFTFGVLWLQATLIFGSLLLLILGTAMLFFPVTLPLQRLLVELISLFAWRVGYFAKRNVLRSQHGNTLISLMIVISATLPTFFATTLAIDIKNTTTDVHLNNGTALIVRKIGLVTVEQNNSLTEVKNRFTAKLLEQVRATGLLGPNVAVTYRFDTRIRDSVGLRDVGVRVYGLDGNVARLTYPEGVTWFEGDATSFDKVLSDPDAVIISEGLAEYFERRVGDPLRLDGAGLDHTRVVNIVGILSRLGGFNGFTSKRTSAQDGRTDLFLNEATFRELTRDPLDGPPDPTFPIMERLMAAPQLRADLTATPPLPPPDSGGGLFKSPPPDSRGGRGGVARVVESEDEVSMAAIAEAAATLRRQFGLTENVTATSTPERIETEQKGARRVQVVILVLTTISFILAIFGVFVVTYIAVYTRRSEIAMLKAMGDSKWHLFGMFLSEALVMTLSATLTGIVAGIVLGYVFRYSFSFRMETPTVAAFDTLVTPYMLLLMTLAAIISTMIATWGYLRRRAIEILRLV